MKTVNLVPNKTICNIVGGEGETKNVFIYIYTKKHFDLILTNMGPVI